MCSKPKGNGSAQTKRNRWAGEGQLGATEASPSRARKSHLDLTKSKGGRRKEPKKKQKINKIGQKAKETARRATGLAGQGQA